MSHLHIRPLNPSLKGFKAGDLLHELRARGFVVSFWCQEDLPDGYNLDEVQAGLTDALTQAGVDYIDEACPEIDTDPDAY